MQLLVPKFKRLRIGWNRRALTKDHALRLCKRERIKIVEMPLRIPGFYMRSKKRAYIAVDSRRTGLDWLRVILHELAHHYVHEEPVHFYQLCPNSKPECEAEFFVMTALLPLSDLKRIERGEPIENFAVTPDVVMARKEIYAMQKL